MPSPSPSPPLPIRWRRNLIAFWMLLLLLHLSAASVAVPGPVGLMNMGNTCYMNSQLQCAFHLPAFRELVTTEGAPVVQKSKLEQYDDDYDDATAETVPESDSEDDEENVESSAKEPPQPPPPSIALTALRKVFLAMSASSRFPVSTREFCRQLGIPTMTQQDAQEFFKLLLPALESEHITELYQGYFIDYIRALDGSGRCKERKEVYLDLSLDISKRSCILDSLRDMFGEPETLRVSDGNGWRPEKGADKVDAHKGASLPADGLPSVLQLHLKRFHYDWQTDCMTKLNRRVTFPEILCMKDICEGETNADDDDDTTYDLQSIVIHAGEYGAGHYYSYVRPDIRSGEWLRFNDMEVEPVSFQDVMDDAFGGCATTTGRKGRGGPLARIGRIFGIGTRNNGGANYGYGGSTSCAYVLQYVRRLDQAKLYPER